MSNEKKMNENEKKERKPLFAKKEKSDKPVKEKKEKPARLVKEKKEKPVKPVKEKKEKPVKQPGEKGNGIWKGTVIPFFKKIALGVKNACSFVWKKVGPFFSWLGQKLAPLWKKIKIIFGEVVNGSFFTIRNKLILGFLVPIFFMVVIGAVAYNKAKDGMGDKFAESTVQTIQMVKENVDSSCDFVKGVGTSFIMDKDLKSLLLGMMNKSPVEEANALNDFRTQLVGYQSGNKFISNMHIIPKETYKLMTSASTEHHVGILDVYRSDVMGSGAFTNWIDKHEKLDAELGIKESEYILAYQIMTDANLSCVVVDVSADSIRLLLDILDLGEGSVVGFVTPGGRELIHSQNKKLTGENGEAVFFGQDFFNEAMQESALTGTFNKVRYNGQNFMFFYSRSDLTGACICALVPIATVTDQAQEIRAVSVIMVIIAVLCVIGIAVVIVEGIQANMKKLSTGFGEVAEGDLTVEIVVKGQDEFNGLADSANHMVRNTKNLVGKVNVATTHLETSAGDVKAASETISSYSEDISHVVEGINTDMENQASHAQECVERANALSQEIQEMTRIMGNIESGIQDTENMIGKGVEKVQLLGEHAKQTTDITLEVGQSIENLKSETEVINRFVAMITEISSQTNLLSLNASIEAARAGEAGRGFSVVAAEIRKLADDSAKAAGEIRSNVGHIVNKAQESVESAGRAQMMVDSQTELVKQVIEIFSEMSRQMGSLTTSLQEVIEHTKRTDLEREKTVSAVDNISGIIADTAENTGAVADAIERLMTSVRNLNEISNVLDENMRELKGEIASFKTE